MDAVIDPPKFPMWKRCDQGEFAWYWSCRQVKGRSLTVSVDASLLKGEREPLLYLERAFYESANAR